MKVKLLEIVLCIVLGFFTGIWLSGNGIHMNESGVEILLSCILWIMIFAYLKRK